MKSHKKITPIRILVSSVWHQEMDFMFYYHVDMLPSVNYVLSRYVVRDRMLIVPLVEAQSILTRKYSSKFQNNNKRTTNWTKIYSMIIYYLTKS